MDNKQNLYWCDYCYTNTIDNEGVEGVEYYGCYSKQAYIKHINTPKHIKSKSLSGEGGEVVCDKCSKTFTAEGYAIHKKRNKPLWECYKTREITQMTCNNFSVGKKRYESVEAYKTSLNKPKQKRTAVGKFSPITNTIRPPNGYGKEKPKELIICSNCNGALFTSQYDTKFLNLHNTFVCKCEDDIKVKQETKIEKDAENNGYIDEKDKEKLKDSMKKTIRTFNEATKKWEYKKNPNYIKISKKIEKDEDGNIITYSGVRIKDSIPLTDEEYDFTERPQFDEICDNCSLPINYDVPINIIIKWEIDTCACLSSEDESE